MAAVLDTRKLTRRLQESGVPDAQADAIVETVLEDRATDAGQLATKRDLEALQTATKHDLTVVQVELEARIEAFQTATKHDLETLRAATKHDLALLEARMEAKIEAATASLVKWFAGVMIAQGLGVVAATVTLVKLLPG